MGLSLKEAEKLLGEQAFSQIRSQPSLKKPSAISKVKQVNAGEEILYSLLKEVFGDYEILREYRFSPERRFRSDFAILELKLLFEVDGFSHHGIRKQQFNKDREKDRLAILSGFTVIRFSSTEIKKQTDKVRGFLQELKLNRRSISGGD